MKARSLHAALFGLLALTVSSVTLADEAEDVVGKVSALEGTAHRSGSAGKEKLAVGSAVRLKDVIAVEAKSRVKITLNDESVIALDETSQLTIDEASFEEQTNARKGFSASLSFGKVWAKVKKAVGGSEARFEVKTDRAVAGVRGTIFRIDAVVVAKTAKPKKNQIWVAKGVVGVEAEVKKAAVAATPAKGERKQIAGPQEVTKEAWEKKFAELQKGQSVTIGEELWKVGSSEAPKDRFASWIARNDDLNDE